MATNISCTEIYRLLFNAYPTGVITHYLRPSTLWQYHFLYEQKFKWMLMGGGGGGCIEK